MPPSFSILIVSWNTHDLVRDCLISIFDNLKACSFEVIIVDNNSTDGSQLMLELFESKFGNIVYISNSENVGFTKANNLAYEVSKYDTIILLNPDTRLIDDHIVRLIKCVNDNVGIGLLSCKLFNQNVKNQKIHRRLPTIKTFFYRYSTIGRLIDRFLWRGYFEKKLKYGDIMREGLVKIDQPGAALLVFRREIIKKLGYLFDEKFPIYGNDVDLSKRVLAIGYSNFVDYSVRIWHKGESSSSSLSSKQARSLRKEWVPRYLRIHHGKFMGFLSKCFMYI